MAPPGQKGPNLLRSSTTSSTRLLGLQGWPGSAWRRGPKEEDGVSSTVPFGGGLRLKVVLLRGAGTQGGSRGSVSRVGVLGQLFNCRHSEGKVGKGEKVDYEKEEKVKMKSVKGRRHH